MGELVTELRERVRRSIDQDIQAIDDAVDAAKTYRDIITHKLMDAVATVKLLDEHGKPSEETDGALRLISTTLKAINDSVDAPIKAVNVKLKQDEQNTLSAAAASDRIDAMLASAKRGQIAGSFPSELLEDKLSTMFDGEINDFELKTNPHDISD